MATTPVDLLGNRPPVEVTPVDPKRRYDVALTTGAICMVATAEKQKELETLPDLEQFFRERGDNEVAMIGCGDDRGPAMDDKKLYPNGEIAWLRYYGGIAGMARVTLVSIAIQFGEEALNHYANNFTGFTKDFGNKVKQGTDNLVIPAMHSAEKQENGLTYSPDNQGDVGCAYAASIGAVTDLNSAEDLIRLGEMEQTMVFGNTTSLVTLEKISKANKAVGRIVFGDEYKNTKLTRNDYQSMEVPVATLRGQHAQPQDTFVVLNFTPNQVSKPVEAAEENKPFYDNDVTQIAEIIMKSYPELAINPEILLRVMEHDIRATRAALTGGEASKLRVVTIGDVGQAINYLNSIKHF